MRIDPITFCALVATPVRFGGRSASALPGRLYTTMSSVELSGLHVRDANMRNSQRARQACVPPPMRSDASKSVALRRVQRRDAPR